MPLFMGRTLAAIATAIVVSACGTAGATTAADGSDPTVSPSVSHASPTAGSNVQDMRDIYSLKRQAAALRLRQSADSGKGCNALDQ